MGSNMTRRSDQSQLDWLWEMYGERPVVSDPNEAKGEDILNKDGVSRAVCRMIQNLVRKLELVPNPHCSNLNDVVIIEDDGDRKVAFSLEKEDHLISVKMRKSTQADVDDNMCNEVNKFVGEFRMMSGKRYLLDLSFMELEGARTNSIETFVEDGKVFSNLRLASSVDKCISVEVTRVGLIIELNLADSPGQAKLVSTKDGLAVENKWADGSDFRFSLCTYAQYMALCNGEGVCGCHDQFEHECECGCADRVISTQKGHIYFITDKNFFYLNGVRYGHTSIVSTDTINHTITDDGIHQFSVNVSGRAGNLLQAIESGLYCDFKWSGSNKNTSFRVYNEKESDYDRLTPEQKKEAIFYCYDTHRIFINGVDFSSIDLIGNPNDSGTSTVYGYVNTKLNSLNDKINTMQKQVNADMTLMSERIGMLREKTEKTEENLNAFKEFEAKNNEGLANSISMVDEKVTLVAEMAEKTDKDAVKWTDNNGVTRDILLENNSDTLSGKSVNGDRVKIVKVDKNNRVSFGDPSFPISFKGSESHPVYNDDHELAFLHELEEETKRAQAKEDEIIGKPEDTSESLSIFGAKLYADGKFENSVKFDNVEDAENPNRKAITLKNHDVLLGTATNGGAYNLAMVSKWDVADYGSKELPINLNGSKERPTYNDDEELALLKDVNKCVVFDNIETPELPGRKAITLKNHDLLLGTATNGTTYNLAMISKWDKADYGTNQLPINLNGSEARPTYNDDKEIALLEDIRIYTGYQPLNAQSIFALTKESTSDEIKKALTYPASAKTISKEDLEKCLTDGLKIRTLYGDISVTWDGQGYVLYMITPSNVMEDVSYKEISIKISEDNTYSVFRKREDVLISKALFDETVNILSGFIGSFETRINALEKASGSKVVNPETGEKYDTVQAAIDANAAHIILYQDLTESINIGNGKNIVIDGNGNKLTGTVKAVKLAEGETSNITIKNMVIDDVKTIGVIGQDQETINQGSANVTLENCVIKNFTDKGLYITNAGNVRLLGCVFDGCSKGKDHMVDFNLCSVQDADIVIKDCKFINIENTLSPIKVCVRGGEDDYAHDVKTGVNLWDGEKYIKQEGKPATIKNLLIENCEFEANETAKADIIIGDVPNYDSPVEPTASPRTSTGNFPYTIKCGKKAKVWKRFEGEDSFVNL